MPLNTSTRWTLLLACTALALSTLGRVAVALTRLEHGKRPNADAVRSARDSLRRIVGRETLDMRAAPLLPKGRIEAKSSQAPLGAEDEVALAARVRWANQPPPHLDAPGECGGLRAAIPLATLTRRALPLMQDAHDPRLTSLVNIVVALRTRGRAGDSYVGLSLSAELAKWAAAHGVAQDAPFRKLRLNTQDIQASIAHDALCREDTIRSARNRGALAEASPVSALGALTFDGDREADVVVSETAARLTTCTPQATDAHRLLDCMRAQPTNYASDLKLFDPSFDIWLAHYTKSQKDIDTALGYSSAE